MYLSATFHEKHLIRLAVAMGPVAGRTLYDYRSSSHVLFIYSHVSSLSVQLRNFLPSLTEKKEWSGGNRSRCVHTTMQASYPLSYHDSHQVCGGINYLKLYYFEAKPSRINSLGLGACDLGEMRYHFNV